LKPSFAGCSPSVEDIPTTAENVSEGEANSHDVASETSMSGHVRNQDPERPLKRRCASCSPSVEENPTITDNVSEYDTNSHDVVSET
jgi:hypothetical protein